MKTCTIYGDMTSDKSSENYPTLNFCDDCYESMAPGTEDSKVVQTQDYDSSLGAECSACGTSEQEEKEEQGL